MKEDLNIKGNEYTYMLSKCTQPGRDESSNRVVFRSVLYHRLRHHANPSKHDRPQSPSSYLPCGLRARLDSLHVRLHLKSHHSPMRKLTQDGSFAQAAAQTSNQMYAFRFMVGLFESPFSPIIIFLLGSWYTKTELAKCVPHLPHPTRPNKILTLPKGASPSGTSPASSGKRPRVSSKPASTRASTGTSAWRAGAGCTSSAGA